ncbi:cilia-and flagella-associated protein 96-like [Convolutriloba macropyga]|uniref:cilia-and flagella-associated protein 96-like n=1 Tax=Convolutriloba macropyga TaxID=536237 RepID=UPI003F51DB22
MAAKTDMERIGVFSEMGYLLGDKYKNPSKGGFNDAAGKGKQMLPGGSKSKSAHRDGYFSDFGRVFEKEAYNDYIKMRRLDRIIAGKKNIGKAWTPSSYPPKMPGAGSHIGTLGGKVDHFSPAVRPGKAHTAPPRNFTTRPGKQGTGYGYADVTIGKVPGYQSDAYERARDQFKKEVEVDKALMKGGSFKLNMHPRDYFDENPYKTDKPLPPVRKATPTKEPTKPFRPSNPGKLLGGGKYGTFDPYPEHPKDVYIYNPNVFRQQKPGEKVFMPSAGPKSYPMNSVVNQMVTKTINETNVPFQQQCY